MYEKIALENDLLNRNMSCNQVCSFSGGDGKILNVLTNIHPRMPKYRSRDHFCQNFLVCSKHITAVVPKVVSFCFRNFEENFNFLNDEKLI
jgi:hypothetical protein